VTEKTVGDMTMEELEAHFKERLAEIIYQFEIVISGSDPPIWRQVQIQGNTTMEQFHAIVEASFGWYDSSLHEFVFGSIMTGTDPDRPHLGPDIVFADEAETCIGHLDISEGEEMLGELMYGSTGWDLHIVLEKKLQRDDEVEYPLCIDAGMAAPPSHIGTMCRYYKMIRVIRDYSHPSYKHFYEVMDGFLMDGGTWDPEAVDLEKINEEMRRRTERGAQNELR
jgi:hypothetical protein